MSPIKRIGDFAMWLWLDGLYHVVDTTLEAGEAGYDCAAFTSKARALREATERAMERTGVQS